MAFRTQKVTASLSRFYRPRYLSLCFRPSVSPIQFSTLDLHVKDVNAGYSGNQVKNRHSMDEYRALDQLSELLPIRHSSSIQKSLTATSSAEELKVRPVDAVLSPEEKLRGIFLQKLRGQAAIERSLSNTGVEVSVDVVARVVNRGNLGGKAMVMFFNWATKQPQIDKGIDSYNIILKALGRRKFFTYMEEMLHDMRFHKIMTNYETVFIVMDSYIRAGRVSKAIQMFGHSEVYGLRCDSESLKVLLQCLCQRSHVHAANLLFSRMKHKVPFDRMTYNLILGGWSRFGKVGKIECTMKAMVEDGFEADGLAYSYVLEGLGRSGKVDEAVEFFKNLKEKGCRLNTSIFNAMIFNFISVGDFDECLKYHENMLSNDCDPSMDTYLRIIPAFLRVRKVVDAVEMFEEMLNREITPTTGAITSFIETLCSYGPPHAALLIYKKARQYGCRISFSAYKLLLMRLSRLGKCGMLLIIWEDLQKSGYSSDLEVYENVINGLCNVGQLANAIVVMEEALSKGFCPSKVICSKLNNKLLSSNKVEMAYKLLLKIKIARRYENSRRYWRAKGWHF